ncbi:hypothetical protein Ct61P_10568 [Colletotrichum tofieldiae]|nr:hypothetical protein Ct61P_10568 [Colletotrichum tofieldiae]
MRSFVTCTVLASLASMAVAQLGHPLFEYPTLSPLRSARTPAPLATSATRTAVRTSCAGRRSNVARRLLRQLGVDRALRPLHGLRLTESIWQYYSNSVTAAASKCGLTPVPSPSGGAAETTAAAATTSAAAAPTTTAAGPATTSTSAAAPLPRSPAGVPATTLSTQASTGAASGTASGAATTSTGAAAGTSAATATRVHSIGTSVVISGVNVVSFVALRNPHPSTVFAGAGKNAAAVGLTFVGMVLAAF